MNIAFFQFLVRDFEHEGVYTALMTIDDDGHYWTIMYHENDGEYVEMYFELEEVLERLDSGEWIVEVAV